MSSGDKLRKVFSREEGNSSLSNVHQSALRALGVNLTFPIWFSLVGIDRGRSEDIAIHEDSFMIPVVSSYAQPSWRGNWKGCFFKRHLHKFKILGVKSCMIGGEAQGVYLQRNQGAISRVGFDWLFEKEGVILTMMINKMIGPDKTDKHIKLLGCVCIADREFHLFLCGRDGRGSIERSIIVNTIEARTALFNSTKDNKSNDKLRWIGKIRVDEIKRVCQGLEEHVDKPISKT